CIVIGVVSVFSSLAFAAQLSAQQPAAVQPPARQENAAPAERYWESQWAFREIDVAKLAERLKSIGIDLGIPLEGNVTVKFEVGVPWTSLTDGAAYRFDGTLTSSRLVVDRFEFLDLRTTVRYRDGVATLSSLTGSAVESGEASNDPAKGNFTGSGSLELVPQGDASANLNVDNISLDPITKLIASLFPSYEPMLPKDGELSGDVQFRAPIKRIDDIASYDLEGTIQADALELGGLPPADLKVGKVFIRDGRLRADKIDLQTTPTSNPSAIRMIGQADLPLTGNVSFSFEVAADDLPIGQVSEWIAASESSEQEGLVQGKLDFRIQGTGELNDRAEQLQWNIAGSLASPSIQIAGVDLGSFEHDVRFTPTNFALTPRRQGSELPARFKIQRVESEYQLTETAFDLTSLAATLFGGQVTGQATVPRRDQEDLVVDLNFRDIRPELRLPVSSSIELKIASTLSGELEWKVPLNRLSDPVAHRGAAKLIASSIMLGDASIGDLNANVSTNQGEFQFDLNGDLFGGTVQGNSTAQLIASDQWNDLPARLQASQLKFDGVSLDALVDLLALRNMGLTGKATGNVSVNFASPSGLGRVIPGTVIPDTTIDLELSQLKYRAQPLSRKLRLAGRIENDVLRIQSLRGDYADGSVSLHGLVYLVDGDGRIHPRFDTRLVASRVDLNRGLWFLGDTADQFLGRASGKATVTGHAESIRVRGNVDGRDLDIYGLPAGNAHSALVATANFQSSKWSVNFPSVRSRVGGGQLEGGLLLSSGRSGGVDITSHWKTRRMDFVRLTDQLGRSSSLASGEISGAISLRGKSIQSIDDLSGRFDFQLGDTRGAAVPGLLAASRFLGPISLANQSFDVGEAKGIIGQGVVVLDEFWLGSDNALVQADGKVYLRSGRLDLNALIATGDYRDIAANFTQLAQQYALRSLLPASAILSVSELLRDRTLVVAVMGSTQSPIVRLRPVETFREETARFLLREGQRLILTGITAGAVDGIDGGF
ncbi:AsmA family protein, partial [Rhodopirellula bahusiensis]|uniref:AsmA family protein n=1 Tax=Rhodopirellula bahusiensis TaxID=2014065 RepID=UPI0032662612